ncbi:MAG: hypothetical protein ACRDDY_02305 [Clostridium sp.]|uniref:hypothetical protein n=1 Tax=Clostridium sp. TaxID=1506 RepID=UPI003EE59599
MERRTLQLKLSKLEERNKCLIEALEKSDKELTDSKHCKYCYYGYGGSNYDYEENCRKCSHKSNFTRIPCECL